MRSAGDANDNYQAGRRSPSLAMRVSSVVGLSPSRSAAPPCPRTRQPTLSSTARMCSFSTSASVTAALGATAARAAGRVMVSSRAGRHDHRALDDIPQLADVARPAVLLERHHVLSTGSRRRACRTASRIPRRSATPGEECPRPAPEAAVSGWGRRSAGRTDPRETYPSAIRCSRFRCVAAMMRMSMRVQKRQSRPRIGKMPCCSPNCWVLVRRFQL